ncbi:MAG: glycosyltransferase family 4 protein [Pseudomonadales bacterium]|nr:glycosyltransferase family 4 protein [Pseudomonadales bacterium]
MNVTILGLGYFNGITGYNIHTQYFFQALRHHFPVLEIDLQDTQRTIKKGIDLWVSSSKENPQTTHIIVHINQPDRINEYLGLPGIHIAFSIWESTLYPGNWLENLKKVDFIWTPSHWGEKILRENGVPKNKLGVIPEGVDTHQFNIETPLLPALTQYEGFKFVHIGKWEERKGTDLVVSAFENLFFDTKDVYLVLLCHNPFRPKFNIEKHLNQIAPKTKERILSINPVKDHQTIASILRSCQCAVFPTAAEGWGLPIIEAMACGLATVVTNYSAPTDYISPSSNLLLDYTLVDIKSPLFQSRNQQWGQWAEPNFDQLKEIMFDCYKDQQKTKELGISAASLIKANWNWNNAASKAAQFIQKRCTAASIN